MTTKLPKWRFAENLGDTDPFVSAALVYIDATQVYDPELIIFGEATVNQDGTLTVLRIIIPRCTMMHNDPATISDNPYHADKPAWYADRLHEVDGYMGEPTGTIARRLTAIDPIERAEAYISLVGYFGGHEFDPYPISHKPNEIRKRYKAAFMRPKTKTPSVL